MKKVMVTLLALFGVYTSAYAVSTIPSNAQDNAATQGSDKSFKQLPIPANSDVDKLGAGSGDDADTANEADPANDKDPEADQGSGQ